MICALMIGRAGSQGFPGKNLKNVLGRKICEYPLIAAKKSKYIKKIFISTDCPKISQVGKKYRAVLLDRSKHLATNKALGEDVFEDAYFKIKKFLQKENEKIELLVLLMANAPTITNKLIDKGYNNIYYSTKTSHNYVDAVTAQWQSNVVPGFTTSAKTRPLVIAKMEEFMRNKLIKINSNRLMSEMKTFIWQNGKAQAMRSYNDDLVMSFAIGCWVRDTVLVENDRAVEYSKHALSAISTSNRSFSTTIPGMIGHKVHTEDDRMQAAKEFNKQYLGIIKG